jgi:antitoxin HicB
MKLYNIRLDLELNPGLDQVYTVTSPDIPELITEGSTMVEILNNVQEVIELLLSAWDEAGEPLPPALQSAELTQITLPVPA